ncbi:GMC family oxidoreductase N-terminal domain-containing protein [Planktomarina temperata]|nr:GMC family oxidoreductase N-terminal domain-containing protein [Planktomarina temperata]
MESYSGGADEFRGTEGPLHVQRSEATEPLARAFLEAGAQAGYQTTDDISGYCQEGFGVFDRTVFKGQRWSASRAYLDPARGRKNLTIVTRALVHRLNLSGNRVTGVLYRDRHGALVNAMARKEVLLSAGAVGSPHLLMLSGIGPKSHLEAMGIAVKADLPGVGQNLQDHPDFVLQFKCLQPVSLWPKTKPWAMVAAGLRWLVAGDGLCASNHFDAVACIRSEAGVEYPDLQLTISPIAVDENWSPLQEHAFQIHVGLMRAHSRGSIELRSDDPADPPRILANYLQDPRDRELMRKGIRWVRELVAQPAFSALKGVEIFPGAQCQSEAELDAKLNSHTSSQWHLSCTARMGPETDRLAVVNSDAKVHGVSGLRVVDASIMPFVTNGNTNAPTIMLAEKLSDTISGLAPLAPMDLPVWKSPNHKNAQR